MSAVRFGVFEFDLASGALTRDGVSIRLQPQPARVLTVLIQRAGELVTRDELRAAIWGRERSGASCEERAQRSELGGAQGSPPFNNATYVDFERGLNFCIAQIRSALGDSAESPRFIETLPRRGYRFIAPITLPRQVIAPAPDIAAVVPPPTDRGSFRPRTWLAVSVIGLLLLVAVAAAAIRFKTPDRAPIRVAVVPFDNETGSTEYDQIAGGVADATVARLATPDRLDRINVIGNAAILRRPRAFRDLKAIGDELHADYVVLAQVKSDGGRVRLIAHLIRVEDEAHVWANTFDRPSFGLDVQAELAETIARSVVDRLAR